MEMYERVEKMREELSDALRNAMAYVSMIENKVRYEPLAQTSTATNNALPELRVAYQK